MDPNLTFPVRIETFYLPLMNCEKEFSLAKWNEVNSTHYRAELTHVLYGLGGSRCFRSADQHLLNLDELYVSTHYSTGRSYNVIGVITFDFSCSLSFYASTFAFSNKFRKCACVIWILIANFTEAYWLRHCLNKAVP